MITKREVFGMLTRLRDAQRDLSEHEFYAREDRGFVNEVLSKELASAIETAEYLMDMAD
jgi:hypothetical protein